MKRLWSGRRGQIWVETVVYTLIGLTIIGLVLAAIKPKINEKQDEISIEQAIDSLNTIDAKIIEVQKATGNKRVVDLKVGKGTMVLDVERDQIRWVLDSRYEYSQEDIEVELGTMTVTTTQDNPWRVTLASNYSVNLTYSESTIDTGQKNFGAVSVPYKLNIENVGTTAGVTTIKISEI